MKTVQTKMGPLEWSLLLILSILWGGSFFFVGVAVKALPPLTIVVLRVGLAALALNLIVRVTGLRMPKGRRYWKAFFGMGLLNNMIPFCLIVWDRRTSPAVSHQSSMPQRQCLRCSWHMPSPMTKKSVEVE